MRTNILYTILVVAATAVFLLPAASVFSQEDMTELKPEAFKSFERPPSVFVHDAHNEKAGIEDDCYLCHHMDGSAPDPDDTSEGTPCSDCHELSPEDGTTALMDAYHTQCKRCHVTEKKGPVACGECHVKK